MIKANSQLGRPSALNVLVAEDTFMLQKLAAAVLTRCGHAVTIACNGREAVKLAEVESFDLILMDIQMPEMDGLEATRKIRDREETTGVHIPIVALTASEDRETCVAAGVDDFMAKPIRPAELIAMIDRVVRPFECVCT